MATHITICPHNPDELCTCSFDTCPCCGGLGIAARCPGCDGAGAICIRTLREAQLAHASQFEKCSQCNGRGWFPISEALIERYGFKMATAVDYIKGRKPVRRAG